MILEYVMCSNYESTNFSYLISDTVKPKPSHSTVSQKKLQEKKPVIPPPLVSKQTSSTVAKSNFAAKSGTSSMQSLNRLPLLPKQASTNTNLNAKSGLPFFKLKGFYLKQKNTTVFQKLLNVAVGY